MSEQMMLFSIPKSERTDLIKRRWEDGFQRWSNEKMQEEANPYGKCGYGADNGPGTLIGWELRTKNVTIEYIDKYGAVQNMVATWKDFAREIADLIWSGEFQEGKASTM